MARLCRSYCIGMMNEMDNPLARFTKYIWWKTPEEALKYPDRLIARVMDRGTWEDVRDLIRIVGKDKLLDVLNHAEVGQFEPRSWSYWHYKLTDIRLGEVPPMPERRFE